MTYIKVVYRFLNVTLYVSCKMLLYFLVYMVDGSVMVRFVPKQS